MLMIDESDREAIRQHSEKIARDVWGDEWRARRRRLRPIIIPASPPTDSVHSMQPWHIARYKPNLKNTAIDSLTREGFECWYPTYRSFRQLPLRKIPPKKRHMARFYIVERLVERFPGYIFIRRLVGKFDINRLFDLAGCGGLVTIGGAPAHLQDFDIEIMRLAEFDGTHDDIAVHDHKRFRVTALSADALRQWSGHSKLNGRLDDSGQMILSVEAFGRVELLIAQADPE